MKYPFGIKYPIKDPYNFIEDFRNRFDYLEFVPALRDEWIIKRRATRFFPKIRNFLDLRSWVGQLLLDKKTGEYFFIFGETGNVDECGFKSYSEFHKINELLVEYSTNKRKQVTNVKLTKEEVKQILGGEVIKGKKVNVMMVKE